MQDDQKVLWRKIAELLNERRLPGGLPSMLFQLNAMTCEMTQNTLYILYEKGCIGGGQKSCSCGKEPRLDPTSSPACVPSLGRLGLEIETSAPTSPVARSSSSPAAFTKIYLCRLGQSTNPYCDCCGAIETVEHNLWK